MFERYIEMIEERLNKDKFQHSLGVAEVSRKLAQKNGVDSNKAYLAGLFHDWAKNLPANELLKIAEEQKLIVHWTERFNPELLHGPVGAWILKRDGIIVDEEVLSSIRFHTTGTSQMSSLEKIVYIADMIEPNRIYPYVDKIREITWQNLDKGVLLGIDNTVGFVIKRGLLLHPSTIEARNWLIKSELED